MYTILFWPIRRIISMLTSSYVSNVVSISLECRTWVIVAVYAHVDE